MQNCKEGDRVRVLSAAKSKAGWIGQVGTVVVANGSHVYVNFDGDRRWSVHFTPRMLEAVEGTDAR